MTSVNVRRRTDHDIPACSDVLVQVHATDGYPVEGVGDPVAWLTPPSLLAAWVAEVNGIVVGHVGVSRPAGEAAVAMWGEHAAAASDSVAVLGRLFVLSRARSHSLGERLTRAAMAHAVELGRRLVLDVMEKDRAAIALYERLGWRRIGSTTHALEESGVPAYCYVSPRVDSVAT
ncbi:GNAT family N-acetyltransferase [Actinoalloteichus caeruleus]|uniref:Acetyltransferase (GNAT) family protein n=1 Tax=Actinoalloteichus caeruleus DSM 43889 TaxID=1120930 RepID=A0ABT1JE27_ACTCY|nr:GNAT family N-acetyltransferase [Actinoalloteichus caeruleus]MCP2330747.1 Acetyltransferase (GNAT) family protein [Actinoalloteichus caeruleus DSM 43889]